jgi:hypothetical protein
MKLKKIVRGKSTIKSENKELMRKITNKNNEQEKKRTGIGEKKTVEKEIRRRIMGERERI